MSKHQDWFDQNNTEIQAFLDEDHGIHRAFINEQGSKKDARHSKKAEEIQHYADNNNNNM